MASRGEVRAQPFTQYDETGLQKLLESCDGRMRALEDRYLRMMGEHIADIGQMWPSDVHRLQQIRRMNRNLKDLQRRIAGAAGMSVEDVERIFEQTAQEDVRMAQRILGVPDTLRVTENEALQRILRAQARETAGRMRDLANSTAVSEPYRRAVDAAVTAVQGGVEDYNTAVRRVIRQAGKAGLRVVDYESGHSRRLDSAARMNVLDGVRHLNQSIMEEVGRQFGADGVEIDAHMLCAEDHLPYQGQQFSQEDFERIQDGLKRPFGEWNCRHSWHPILLGISPPTYTDEQLAEMRRYSTEQIEIGGRTKTRYEWSQEMRRMEVAVRQEKDAATLAAAVGDGELRRECQGTITELNREYTELSRQAGLKPEYERTYVSGFRDANYRVTSEQIARAQEALGIPEAGERTRLQTHYTNDVPLADLDKTEFTGKFNGLAGSPQADAAIRECAVEMLKHRNGTNGEDLYLFDGDTGEILHRLITSEKDLGVQYDEGTLRAIEAAHAEGRFIIAMHNHPNGLPPTLDDGSSAFVHGYDMGVVVGHNLEMWTYGKTKAAIPEIVCALLHNGLAGKLRSTIDFDDQMWYSFLAISGMEVERR